MTLDARIAQEGGDDPLVIDPATATNQTASPQTVELILSAEFSVRPSAPGVAMHAPYAAGAPINDTTGPFLTQLPLRTCRVVLGFGGDNPVTFTVTGILPSGGAASDVIVAAGAGTYEGTIAFDEVTSFTSNVNPGGTVDLETGKGFGVGILPVHEVFQAVGVNGVVEQAAVFSAPNATLVPLTAPDGSRVFTYRIAWTHTHTTVAHTHIQAAHTHVTS